VLLSLLATLLIVLALLVTARQNLRACAVAHPPGAYVGIANESALIIWDADTKTEHFIRRATFDTKADDFGFLVPTPTKPNLGEAHDYTFKMLEKITAPEERTSLVIMRPGEHGAASPNERADTIEVVETKRLGDFDAVVLKADDAKALDQWLQKNGYASEASLTDWLKSYVSKRWFLTAFKIAKEAKQQPRAIASAVRMSFVTPKPFFPYSEPASGRTIPLPQRLLRVYLLASRPMTGTLGEGAAPWPGTTVWSGSIPKEEPDFLIYAMRMHDKIKAAAWWLTEFEDRSSPRPGTDDVYFADSPDQVPVRRPPITHHLIHVEAARGPLLTDWAATMAIVIGAVVILLLGVVFLLRPRRSA